ncbi:MAG: type III-A CRISPR-associated RAMP protein Csm5 [Anaerolineales bacterium]|jgi:CRISPR-associated protein Csm5|nr:type III-A CRISPR-associated RAMP protein Csm5 [Anaerolineales bacterium]
MTVYNVSLQTLSPLHIGDGNELRQGFDFMVRGNATYRLNEDAILQAKQDLLRPDRSGHYPTPGALLSEADYERDEYFRYILRGAARSAKMDARLKSFIKDVYDRPYIPGSSLKGALRTALAWTGWSEVNLKLDRGLIGNSRAWAGQRLERKIFGPDPNHDLLRALHVSDLFGPQQAGGKLLVVNAQVLTKRTAQSPIELETLPGEVSFTGSITLDETLFAPFAERELGFGNRRRWLDELMPRAQKHSHARCLELAEWFGNADPGYAPLANFYNQLANAKLAPHQALIQLGWGAGWDGKTFWTHLQKEEYLFEQLIIDFRMNKAGRNSRREPGDAFPRSKRAAMSVKQGVSRPLAPFGWVLLELRKT